MLREQLSCHRRIALDYNSKAQFLVAHSKEETFDIFERCRVLIEFAEHFGTDGKQISFSSLRLEQNGQTVVPKNSRTKLRDKEHLPNTLNPPVKVTWKAKCVSLAQKASCGASCRSPEESSYPQLIALALHTADLLQEGGPSESSSASLCPLLHPPVWTREAVLIPGQALVTSPWVHLGPTGVPRVLWPCWQTCCSLFSSNKKQDMMSWFLPWILRIGWLRGWDISGGRERGLCACWEREGLCNKEADATSPCQ